MTNCCKTWWLKISFIISQFLWVRSSDAAELGPLALDLPQGCKYLKAQLGKDPLPCSFTGLLAGFGFPRDFVPCYIGLPPEHLTTWKLASRTRSHWKVRKPSEKSECPCRIETYKMFSIPGTPKISWLRTACNFPKVLWKTPKGGGSWGNRTWLWNILPSLIFTLPTSWDFPWA